MLETLFAFSITIWAMRASFHITHGKASKQLNLNLPTGKVYPAYTNITLDLQIKFKTIIRNTFTINWGI